MKNKKYISVLSLLLSLFMFTGVACDDGDSSSVEKVENTNSEKISWNEGTHDFTAKDTDNYLVRNGQTEYKLVYPVDSGKSEQMKKARSEFIYFFKEATGINIVEISDKNLIHSPSNKYISLGQTTLFEEVEIELDPTELTMEGTRIVTKDQTVFLAGGSDYGTVYAVYDFMSIMFDYEFYYVDTYKINTGVANAKLKDFDVTNIPDIEYRCQNFGFISGTNAYRYRMPYTYAGLLQPIFSEWGSGEGDRENLIVNTKSTSKTAHNSLYYVPKNVYQGEHPNWYSTAGEQLCYTARGDDEELELLAKECADKMKASFKVYLPDKYPFRTSASLTMEDNTGTCSCEACKLSKAQYGTDSAAVVRFMNMVNDDVQAWMKEQVGQPWYREEIYTIFFAYNGFQDAPAHYDETTGEWVANDPSVVCGEGLSPWYAGINTEFQQSIHSQVNRIPLETIRGWGALSDGVYLWTYATNFHGFLLMYDSFNCYNPSYYQELVAANARMLFQQMQGIQTGSGTTFHNLKVYLNSKLAWNCNLDYNELIDGYFENVYKEAAPYMKSLWMNERLYASKINTEHNMWGKQGIYSMLDNRKYWDFGVLMGWIDLCDQALEAVAKYEKINPKLYANIKKNIDAEYISPGYLVLKYHSSQLSETALKAEQKRLKAAVELCGTCATAENAITALTTFVQYF